MCDINKDDSMFSFKVLFLVIILVNKVQHVNFKRITKGVVILRTLDLKVNHVNIPNRVLVRMDITNA